MDNVTSHTQIEQGVGKTKTPTCSDIITVLRETPFEELNAVIEHYAHDERKSVQAAVTRAVKRYELERTARARVNDMYELQEELGGAGTIIGVDEVGRGPLAGPLAVAAVILPQEHHIWGLNDSKKLTSLERERLDTQIRAHARAVGIAFTSPEDIDRFGIVSCLRETMKCAILQTGVEPDCVLIDGNPIHAHPKEKTLVKGDSRIASIAAASIVAKVARDRLMQDLDTRYPQYHFAENKGYGSKAHIDAIKTYGLSPVHRKSFCKHFTVA